MSAPFMQLYVADYLGDTQHLTTEQHGAYLLLLMNMWRQGGSLPAEGKTLARITRVSARRWHLIEAELMAFFDNEEGRITQRRLVEEYQKAVSKSEKRSISGKLGGSAKSLNSKEPAVANAKQLPKHSPEPEPYTKQETPAASIEASPPKGDRTPAKRGSRVDGFIPDILVATEMGMAEATARFESEQFLDYWRGVPGAKGVKLDWPATWRNRVREQIQRNGGGARAAPNRMIQRQPPPNAPSSSYGIAALEELREDLRRNQRHEPVIEHDDGGKILGFEPRWRAV